MRLAPTPEDVVVWEALRNRRLDGWRFRRQYAIDRFIVDFYCAEARLIVEVDGPIHAGSVRLDAARQVVLERRGFRVSRLTNAEVNADPAAAVVRVRHALGTNGER
jgi:very-short-patch-repair endonuclease